MQNLCLIEVAPMTERVIKRTLNGETVDGLPVMAYVEDKDTGLGPIPVTSYHWSTPGAGAKNVRRLFTEDAVFKVIDDLRAKARALLTDYKKLADSGDAGFWQAEDIPEWIELDAAIKGFEKEK